MFTEIVAYSAIILSLFLIVLIILKSHKGRADWILVCWFLGISAHCVVLFLNIAKGFSENVIIQSAGSSFAVLHIPLIYVYVRSLIDGFSWKALIDSLLPFICYSLVFYYLIAHEFLYSHGLERYVSNDAPFWAVVVAPSMIIVVIVFIFLIKRIVKRQEAALHQNYSSESKLTLAWINYWLITLAIGAIVIIGCMLAADAGVFNHSIAYSITFLFIDIQLLIVGIYGLKQTPFIIERNVSTEFDTKSHAKSKYERSALTDDQMLQIEKSIKNEMENEQYFLNPDLTIQDFASLLGYSSAQISQTLNQKMETNFFDFVNAYRIEFVKERLLNQEFAHFSIFGIALDSGFSSKSTFNKCFRKFVGVTPSAFKKIHKK